jgi:hypothetical protein
MSKLGRVCLRGTAGAIPETSESSAAQPGEKARILAIFRSGRAVIQLEKPEIASPISFAPMKTNSTAMIAAL